MCLASVIIAHATRTVQSTPDFALTAATEVTGKNLGRTPHTASWTRQLTWRSLPLGLVTRSLRRP